MLLLCGTGRDCLLFDSENGKIQGKKMSAAWQISRRFGQAEGAWTRFATGYCITATVSVKSDPLSPRG